MTYLSLTLVIKMVISVCMATYNGEKYLKEQIDSILEQLTEHDELIVSDDGSLDETLNILGRYKDSRIKIVHHVKNSKQLYNFCYPTQNFENALINARGDIVFLADQDDVWVDGKIRKMVSKLATCDIVLSDCSFVDANLSILTVSKIKFEKVKIGALRNLYKNGYLGSSIAFRRNILDFALPFPKNVPHDLWIGLVGGYVGKFEILPEVTMLYRRHDSNVSSTNNKLLKEQIFDSSSVRLNKNSNSMIFRIKYRSIVIWEFLLFIINNHFPKMVR